MDMNGERVLVTGASSGLGADFAATLARAGAKLALAARRPDRLEQVAKAIRDGGGTAVSIVMDVEDPASVTAGVAAAEQALGGLTGLVNNAGVASGAPALEITEADWRRVVGVNLDGAFRVARAVARGMVARGQGGAMVMLSSILAKRVQPGVAAYAAAKAGVDHLTRALALEWARHGIRVNALAPGYFPSEMTEAYLHSEAGRKMLQSIPTRRFGLPSDLEAPLLLLMSKAGAHITGVTLPVDGGHLLKSL